MYPHGVNMWVMAALQLLLQVNDNVTFRLLKRPRDSIIPTEMHPTDLNPAPGTVSTEEDGHINRGGLPPTPEASWGKERGANIADANVSGQASKSHKGDKSRGGKLRRGNKQDAQGLHGFGGSGFNKYAKFTTVADGKAFWKAAAEELASYAAQVQIE